MPDIFKTSLALRSEQDANPSVADSLQDTRKQIGFVPNMYAAMANLPALLDAYKYGYQLVRLRAGFNATEQEVLFLTISRENDCQYCVAAHSVVADMGKVPAEVTAAIREDRPIGDAKLEALREFTRTMVRSGGRPSSASATAFLDAGYSETQILGIILAISVKTLSNYSNHIFHTKIDDAFAHRSWKSPAAPSIAA